MKNILKSIIYFLKGHQILVLLATLSFMSFVLYRQYVFAGRLFLFEDFGSDSVRVSLPTYTYLFDWFNHGMPFWSDKMGIGTSVLSHPDIVFDPFTYILFLLGRGGIIHMFVYMVIAKIIFSGIFFWIFLGKYKLSSFAKLISAITYAFGGYEIVTGQNYVFATMYVYLPLILLGFEIWLQNKRGWFLALMLTFTALYFFYFFYMTAIFLAIYAMFRYFMLNSFELKHFLSYAFSLAGYILLSLGLSAFFLFPSLALTLTNLRIGSSVPALSNMFVPNIKIILTALGRLFEYDVFGKTKLYLGYKGDYFQLALFCGVITLVIASQIFNEENNRKKIIYVIFSIVLIGLLYIPFFSYLFNGFSDFNYRWTYILQFSLALFLAIAIDRVFGKLKLNYKILFFTVGIWTLISLLIIFAVSIMTPGDIVSLTNLHMSIQQFGHAFIKNFRLFYVDYVFIVVYVLLTMLFFHTQYKNVIKIIILVLVCVEMVWFPQDLINNRLTTAPDPVKYSLGYFDGTNGAVSYLKEIDNSIYRVDKSYDSVISEYGHTPSDNDAMVQGYRGLRSYNANNQPNYIHFLLNADVFVRYPNAVMPAGTKPQNLKYVDFHYINGVGDRYLLQSFLGVKYYLIKNESKIVLPDYYLYVDTINDINIYKNNHYLPLGFTFNSFITHDEFMGLNTSEKDLALLSFVVIDNQNELSNLLSRNIVKKLNDIVAETDVTNLIKERRKDCLQIISYKEDDIVGTIGITENKVLVLTIPYDKGWTLYVNGNRNNFLKVDGGLIGIELNSGLYTIELKYFPPKMTLGIIISIITVLLGIFLIRKYIVRVVSARCVWLRQLYGLNHPITYPVLKNNISMMRSKIIWQLKINYKKTVFYTSAIIGILSFFLGGLITRGYSFYSFFSSDKKDYFMDFFNVLRSLFNGPYNYGSIYPPLPLLFYKLMVRLVPYDIVEKSASVIRATQSGEIIFLLYVLITLLIFIILLIEVKKGIKIEKYAFAFVTLFSAPFLFQFERANIIFVALSFLMMFVFFKDSKNRFMREVAIGSLSISIGIKVYPVIFMILLFREKRYKDIYKVCIYCMMLFTLPFFALGGIGYMLRFFKNVFFTIDLATEWGFGYMVNIQNMMRILGGFIGDFGKSPIVIGRVISIIVLILGSISAYFMHSKWKTIALLILLMIIVPFISYEYTLIFMIIPLIMFLDNDEKDKVNEKVYLVCFILLFIPLALGKVDAINNGFEYVALPLTYGILIQNVVLFVMTFFLIKDGLMENELKSVRNYLASLMKKIYFTKHKGFISYILIIIKIILTVLIVLLIFGDSIFAIFYNDFKTKQLNSYIAKINKVQKSHPFIYTVEPQYLHLADSVVVMGINFDLKRGRHVKLMSNYGEITPLRWSNSRFEFSIPLDWRPGIIKIWIESPSTNQNSKNYIGNEVEITLVDRLGKFNDDDVRYFGQIKYLGTGARDINNFKNYKLREYKFSRWIPTKAFQIYADILEFKNKIKIDK